MLKSDNLQSVLSLYKLKKRLQLQWMVFRLTATGSIRTTRNRRRIAGVEIHKNPHSCSSQFGGYRNCK
ncbi:UNKNOWN [Stylonychia lemnae]|uniref:Uncharacterized protein n=1 Tax=Stylonychia lemnae TaxID=5949 RepID=A0A077ZY51_STYLE|nr:UNKNOWN [Stylonychia lemnae]|eukprot:CDW74557.1 UNKNOWN [Stylonychia lemnae]